MNFEGFILDIGKCFSPSRESSGMTSDSQKVAENCAIYTLCAFCYTGNSLPDPLLEATARSALRLIWTHR